MSRERRIKAHARIRAGQPPALRQAAIASCSVLQQEVADGVLYRLEHAIVTAPASASSLQGVSGKRRAPIDAAKHDSADRPSAAR